MLYSGEFQYLFSVSKPNSEIRKKNYWNVFGTAITNKTVGRFYSKPITSTAKDPVLLSLREVKLIDPNWKQ